MKQSMLSLAWTDFWQQRNPRERGFLTLAFALIIAALVYLIALAPALKTIQTQEKAIPQLRQQVSEMNLLSDQYSQIASVMAQSVAPVTREVLESSLQRRGIKVQSMAISEDIIRIQISTVSYSNLMEWLLEMQKVTRLTVKILN